MTEKKITSISLEWFNYEEHCVEDKSYSRTTFYRRTRKLTYEEFDGYRNCIKCVEVFVPRNEVNGFFEFLTAHKSLIAQQKDYSIEVCDGSAWKMNLRCSNNSVIKLHGSVLYPPCGKYIEAQLCSFLQTEKKQVLYLFGCNQTYINTHAIRRFAKKWLSFFSKSHLDNLLFESCDFADECMTYGFEMDCGKSFERKYPGKSVFETTDGLLEVINEVDDILLLGNAIFSQWRYYTHWAMSGLDKFQEWFFIAFSQLLKLSEKS